MTGHLACGHLARVDRILACLAAPRRSPIRSRGGPHTCDDVRMAATTGGDQRDALGRTALQILRRALPDDASVEVCLAADGNRARSASESRARIVVGSPDAVGRL